MVFLKDFFLKKVHFEKNQQTTKKHEKLPSMQLVNVMLYLTFRFHINLQEDEDNVAFHFNPRQQGDLVVRNTKEGGDWQEEERDIPYFPFNEGRTFQIKIEVTSECFRVYVNGRYFLDYAHRMDLHRIRALYLSEGAEYYDATFQNKHVSSSCC